MVYHDIPHGAALELGRRLRKQPPYLVQFVVPGVEGILDVLNDPIVTH